MPSDVKHILVVTLSNIGDVILTFPVLDILRRDFPQAQLSIVCGPKGRPFFVDNPVFTQVYTMPKRDPLAKKLSFIKALRQQRFDLVIDLKNSALPFLISARWYTSPFLKRNFKEHMRRQHLRRLASRHDFVEVAAPRQVLQPTAADQNQVQQWINEHLAPQHFVVVAPGAADINKRWPTERFVELAEQLFHDFQLTPVYVGDQNDHNLLQKLTVSPPLTGLDLTGKATLPQLGLLMQQAALVISNDSSPMHLASYLDVPILALFGPTNPQRYGPWARQSCIVRNNKTCRACQGEDRPHDCMSGITVEMVVSQLQVRKDGIRFHSPGTAFE